MNDSVLVMDKIIPCDHVFWIVIQNAFQWPIFYTFVSGLSMIFMATKNMYESTFALRKWTGAI